MLTDTQCRTTKPKDKPYKLSDGKGKRKLHLTAILQEWSGCGQVFRNSLDR